MSLQTTPSDPSKSRMYSGVPQEERTRLRRRRLLDAGIEVFGRQGLSQATMRDICANARLSERYFYESFKSTNDIFDAVYELLVRDMTTAISSAVMDAPPVESTLLESGLRAFFNFIHQDPRRVQILLIDGVWRGQTRLREGLSQVQAYQHLIQTLTLGLHPKLSPEINPGLVASGLVGAAIHAAIAWAETGFQADLDSVVKHNLSAWNGLRRWMKTSAPGSEATPEEAELVAHVRQVFRPPEPR